MGKSIVLRNPVLVRWLERFANGTETAVFKKGMELYRNKRIWDYHASAKGIRASLEDRDSSFFQVTVRWDTPFASDRLRSDTTPDPAEMHVHCTCHNRRMPCEHVAAAVIYWVITIDRKEKRRNPRAVPDFSETDYQEKIEAFKARSASIPPSYAVFRPEHLKIRPDLQKKFTEISERVMEMMRD
ncbi:hypothetical protein EWH99_03805 [Sporolactobacillus sp. THM7-7]|nr:hypothetical protein EWH99_03805 [Sporolactobacillus sp. THM7-7]